MKPKEEDSEIGNILGGLIVLAFVIGVAFLTVKSIDACIPKPPPAKIELEKDARIEKLDITVYVVKKITNKPAVYLCRYDNGIGAVPRFTQIECNESELTPVIEKP